MEENEKIEEQIKLIQKFIFNDDVQHILSNINDNLMDFNILEITGMGNQEIKHSNILGWLFDDSEHNLEYHILDNFLKKVIEENRKDGEHKEILDSLQSYIYLAKKKKEITIYREKDNIDLLIVDEANKVVITIENKVDASERIEGDDGGQLKKYEDIINNKYDESYKKYFLFLTINLEEPSVGNEKWLKSSHFMITDIIKNTLKTKDITAKTKIILESYVDLLKRNGIVKDEELRELCKNIWNKKEYRNAFEIILNNRPDKVDNIVEIIENFIEQKIKKTPKLERGVYNIYFKINDSSPLTYRFKYSIGNKKFILYIVTDKDKYEEIETTEIINFGFKIYTGTSQHGGYKSIVDNHYICSEDDDKFEENVKLCLVNCKNLDKHYITIKQEDK